MDGVIQIAVPVVCAVWLAGLCLTAALGAAGYAAWQRIRNRELEQQLAEEHRAWESLLHGIEVIVPQGCHLAGLVNGTESGKGYPLLKSRQGAFSVSRQESSLIVSIFQRPSAEVRPLHSTAQQVDHGGKAKAAAGD